MVYLYNDCVNHNQYFWVNFSVMFMDLYTNKICLTVCKEVHVQEKIYKCQQYWHKDNYKHYDVLIVWKIVDI